MKKRIIPVISVLLIVAFVSSFFGCGTRANWAAQKSDTKMNELNLREANGSEKYIVFAALDEAGDLISSGSSTATASYAVVGYTGLVAELIIPDEFAPTGGEAKPVTKLLAVDPYSDYKCYRNGVSYTGEDARLQNNTVVTTLSFGSNMSYVGAGVCAGMTNLYDVIFTRSGESVEIGAYAFAGCPNLSRLTYSRTDDYYSFGEYPQSKVTDNEIITALNAQAGTLPTISNPQNWTSYQYLTTNAMWYVDLSYSGNRYRGVYFTTRRNTYQLQHGYETNSVYWFKYEPISWRILSEDNGKILLFAESCLDCQPFLASYSSAIVTDGENNSVTVYYNNLEGTPSGTYANNYKYSQIRKWLNETFYETAFNSIQRSMIITSIVDNSPQSTNQFNNATIWNGGINEYACENTEDKVFLASIKEITNAAYGFAQNSGSYDTIRRKAASDYAKSQGIFKNYETDSLEKFPWWVRSPYFNGSRQMRYVFVQGYVSGTYFPSVNTFAYGVVPALWLRQS